MHSDIRGPAPIDALGAADFKDSVNDMQTMLFDAASVLDLIQHDEMGDSHRLAVARLASRALEGAAAVCANDAVLMADKLASYFGALSGGGDDGVE